MDTVLDVTIYHVQCCIPEFQKGTVLCSCDVLENGVVHPHMFRQDAVELGPKLIPSGVCCPGLEPLPKWPPVVIVVAGDVHVFQYNHHTKLKPPMF